MPHVSILVPVYDRADDMRVLLDKLCAQSYREFEVVVVDDASPTPLRNVIDPEAFNYPLHIHRNPTNLGIGGARNRALSLAQGNLLIWIDSDSAPLDDTWLAGHVAAHRDGIPALGLDAEQSFVLHSRVESQITSMASAAFRYSNWFISCQLTSYRASSHVPANNTSFRRAVLETVGTLDCAFEVAEDVEWALRAQRAGIPLVYTPEFPVSHRDPATFEELWRSYRKMGRYAALVRRKHPHSPYAWLYPANPLLAMVWALPLALLFTLFTVIQWWPREKRVVLYSPAIFIANLANSVGMLELALGRRKERPLEKPER